MHAFCTYIFTKVYYRLQRGLSAIAELLVCLAVVLQVGAK